MKPVVARVYIIYIFMNICICMCIYIYIHTSWIHLYICIHFKRTIHYPGTQLASLPNEASRGSYIYIDSHLDIDIDIDIDMDRSIDIRYRSIDL